MALTPGGSKTRGILKHWEESARALKTDRVGRLLIQSNYPINPYLGTDLHAPRSRRGHSHFGNHGRHPSPLSRW
jgi:hypothetical protein